MIRCRSCGANALRHIVSLGKIPLANALLTAEQLAAGNERRFPLDLVFCEQCSLVQITETVPPEELFSDYVYFSSFSETAVRSAKELAMRLVADRALDGRGRVIEIASNDGYLLQHYREAGVPVLGIEPASNIASFAVQRGIPTRCEFFGIECANRLASEGLRADVIHANNVLAHVPDLNGVVTGISAVLKSDGVAVIEVPWLRDLVDNCEFDTIYHEHLCYFSLNALKTLMERHDLVVADVEHLPIHGGSLRLFVEHAGARTSERAQRTLDDEAAAGMLAFDYYRDFGERITILKRELQALLHSLKAGGKRIVAYGASAKGSTLLNFFGIDCDTLDFVADRSTAKQGRFTPGIHLPIVGAETLLTEQPDYVLLLTWNFADEILAQQDEYRRRGGKFIVPIPRVRVV